MKTVIQLLVETPFSQALGWALFHSLWQGTILAAVAGLFRGSARTRYAAGCIALAVTLMSFVGTFCVYFPFSHPAPDAANRAILAAPPFSNGPSAPISRTAELLPWLTPFWIAGAILFQLRFAAAWINARQLRRRAVCDAPAVWQSRLAALAARMGVSRPVELLESGLANLPVAIGFLRPVIVFPAGIIASMPPAHVDWILLHELAHIRRHDYVVNILQTLAEGILFYHPAVWWLSNVIRTEREHCCDDLAIAASGAATADSATYDYALALTALEESRWAGSSTQPAAGVAASGGNLKMRIHRLLYPQRPAAAFSVAPLLVASFAVAAWQFAAAQPAPVDAFQTWLQEDVAYIISPREREAFGQLKTDPERERFIEQFWIRRDTTPGTARNEFKDEHYRRIGYANNRFRTSKKSGWRTDRGRIYILFGPPDQLESHPNGRAGGPPLESWRYNSIANIGKDVIVDFLDSNRDGDYRQTTDPNRNN